MDTEHTIPMYPTIEQTLEIMKGAYLACAHDGMGILNEIEIAKNMMIMSSAIKVMEKETDEAFAEIVWNVFTEAYGEFWGAYDQLSILAHEALEVEDEEEDIEVEDEELIFFEFDIDEGEGSLKKDNLVVMSIPAKRELIAHDTDTI